MTLEIPTERCVACGKHSYRIIPWGAGGVKGGPINAIIRSAVIVQAVVIEVAPCRTLRFGDHCHHGRAGDGPGIRQCGDDRDFDAGRQGVA